MVLRTAPATLLVYTDGEVVGDGIIRLVFAYALKRAQPQLKLTWLSSGYSAYETVLRSLATPVIDELIILPNRAIPFRELFTGPVVLAGRRFDLVIDTQRKVKRSFWLSRIKHGMFASASANHWLSDVTLPVRHPRFIDQITALYEAATGTRLSLLPPPLPDASWSHEAAKLLPEGVRYVGFVVGAGHPDKCWPLAHFIALAHAVAQHGAVPVFFLGPQELSLKDSLSAQLPQAVFPLQAHAAIDTSSPCFTIALAARLHVAVANDSGGGHLLAAGGCPLITLFRAETVQQKFLPCAPRVVAFAPESFGGNHIRDIPLQPVLQALQGFLA